MPTLAIPVTPEERLSLAALARLTPAQLVRRGLDATAGDDDGRSPLTVAQLRDELTDMPAFSNGVSEFIDALTGDSPVYVELHNDDDGVTDVEIGVLLQGHREQKTGVMLGVINHIENEASPELRLAQAVLGTAQAALRAIS